MSKFLVDLYPSAVSAADLWRSRGNFFFLYYLAEYNDIEN